MPVRKPLLVRITFILLIVGFLASLTLIPTAAVSQTVAFEPAADAYGNAGSPTTNYGASNVLRADASPVVNSYLRFTVSGLLGQTVSRALLKIYANTATSQGLVAKSVANVTWSEGTLNYNNAPAMSATLATSTMVLAGTWVTLDVTPYVIGNGVYSLGLTTSGSTAISLASREAGVNAPQLILTVSGSAPTPTLQPTSGGSGNILLLAGDICKHDLGATDYTANCKKTGDLVRTVLVANPGAQV